MACDPQLSRVFLGGLPPIMKVHIRNDASGQWLENSIRYSVADADASRPGGEAVVAKLSEVLFIETLRRTSRCFPKNKPGGWPAFGTRKLEKRWPFCIASPLIHGRSLHLRTRLAFSFRPGRAFPALSLRDSIAYLTRWRFTSGRSSSPLRAIAWRRLRQKLGMSQSRPLTGPSNVSSVSRPPDSAANRNQRTVKAVRQPS